MMALFSEKTVSSGKQLSFPKLMIGTITGNVILFSSPGVGVVVYSGGEKLGKHASDWDMSAFEDYNEEVRLRNTTP